MKSIYEEMGGTYSKHGDYYLPDLTLGPPETRPIGVWGQRRCRYLKEHRRLFYYNLLTSGQLDHHLADIEEEAEEMYDRLMKQYAEREGLTDELKARDMMAWVRGMNSVQARVREVVNSEVIYN